MTVNEIKFKFTFIPLKGKKNAMSAISIVAALSEFKDVETFLTDVLEEIQDRFSTVSVDGLLVKTVSIHKPFDLKTYFESNDVDAIQGLTDFFTEGTDSLSQNAVDLLLDSTNTDAYELLAKLWFCLDHELKVSRQRWENIFTVRIESDVDTVGDVEVPTGWAKAFLKKREPQLASELARLDLEKYFAYDQYVASYVEKEQLLTSTFGGVYFVYSWMAE